MYLILFCLSAIGVIIYDWKIQQIPIWLIIINYSLLCLLINPILLIGNFVILLIKKFDKPIDWLYILLLCYLIMMYNNIYTYISIIITLIYILSIKKDKISFMVPIEFMYIVQLIGFITK